MRTSRLFASIGGACFLLAAVAQAPQGFSYQAVARNAAGDPLSAQPIGVQFILHQGNALGAVVYAESHAAATNEHGLFSLQVGGGSASAGTFSAIDWSHGPYFLEVGLDVSSSGSFTSIGTQQLLSVPYALYAGKSNVPDGTEVGQILHWTGAAWAADSGIYVAGKRFGIGVQQPDYPLGIQAKGGKLFTLVGAPGPVGEDRWGAVISNENTDSSGLSLDEISDGGSVSRFFIEHGTGNIGIGTTAPDAPLSVKAMPSGVLTSFFQTGDFPTQSQFSLSLPHMGTDSVGLSLDEVRSGATSSRLFIESSTGRVGLGTTRPRAPLHIVADSTDGSAIRIFVANAATGPGVFNPAAWNLTTNPAALNNPGFSIDDATSGVGTSRLFISGTTGNVGIGGTHPEAPLSIEPRDYLYQKFENGDIPDQQQFTIGSSSGGHTGLTFDQGLSGARTSRLFLDASTGFVGIGNTTPEAPLSQQPRDYLYQKFQDGDIPSGSDFWISSGSPGVAGLSIDQGLAGARESRLFVQSSTGNIGIGTDDPPAPLSLRSRNILKTFFQSGEHPAQSDFAITSSDTTGFGIDQGIPGSQVSRLFIQASTGNVGIGTLQPEEKLHIESSTSAGITGLRILNTATVANQGWSLGHLQDASSARDGAFALAEKNGSSLLERITVLPSGRVGINEPIPDTKLHVSRDLAEPGAALGLFEGTGIMTIGPITNNIVADYRGIQARTGSYAGGSTTIGLAASELNLQRVGGSVLIHGDDAIDSHKVVVTEDGNFGLGVSAPAEKLHVNGRIVIGDSQNSAAVDGTIRWTGTDFEGRKGGVWKSLTTQTVTDGFVSSAMPNAIHYSPAAGGRIGINEPLPYVPLHVCRSEADPVPDLSLLENSGITVLGPIIGQNLGLDSHQLQARTGALIPGTSTLSLSASTLNIQPVGGDVVFHSDASMPDDHKVVITDGGLLGVGKAPIERLDVNGAIRIGSSLASADGTIRYTGTDFQGRANGAWTSLGSLWEKVDNSDISFNRPGAKVGIGVELPTSALHVVQDGGMPSGESSAAFVSLIDSQLNLMDDRDLIGLRLVTQGSSSGTGNSRNIGLYVSDVSGQSAASNNLAAVLNGNVVVGGLSAAAPPVGAGGTNVLAIQNGSMPASPPGSTANGGIQIFSGDQAPGGPSIFQVMNGDGTVIRLYREAALSPPDVSIVDGSYDANEEAVISNLRQRIDQLEQVLRAYGLLQ